MRAELNALVWMTLAVRVGLFISVVSFLAKRLLSLRKEIEERKFGGRYSVPTIVRGLFSPRRDWEENFDHKDVRVLRAARVYLIQVIFLTLLILLVNQRARLYIDSQFEKHATPNASEVDD